MKDWFDSSSQPPLPLPSIIDLGRLATAAGSLGDQSPEPKLTPDPKRESDEQVRQMVLYDRERALRDLLLTFRAQTMRDAVAHLYVGFLAAEDLANLEMPEAELSRCAVTLRRVFLSTIPLVAQAAELDLAEIGGEYIPGCATREFPAEA